MPGRGILHRRSILAWEVDRACHHKVRVMATYPTDSWVTMVLLHRTTSRMVFISTTKALVASIQVRGWATTRAYRDTGRWVPKEEVHREGRPNR